MRKNNVSVKYWMAIFAMLLNAALQAADMPIDITFSAEGLGSSVETVKVENLTHTEIEPVTLSGNDVLRLGDDAGIPGDVNEDGAVNINDVVAIINVMAGTASWPNANVNGDGAGSVDINDVVAVINIMAGKGAKARKTALNKMRMTNAAESPFTAAFISAAANANVVRMDFHEGDILRFEGKCGEMRTIVVNAPERSHDVPFYFYPCKDVSGNTYPIIEAGGLLWMAEDLHAVSNLKGVSIFYGDEQSEWAEAKANKETTAMLMVADDEGNDIYYTYAAARQALPEGWELPTLGELEAVSRNLGGFEVVGDKMKRSGDRESFRDKRSSLPDSLQLRISPKGYVSEEGVITDKNSGFVLTQTRENSKALYMLISNGSDKGDMTLNGLPSYAAVHVRGVRPAPSAYTSMMNKLYASNQTKFRMDLPRKADGAQTDEKNVYTGEVNPYTGTPYGQYYTIDHSTKQIVMDVSGQKCMGWVTAGNDYVPWVPDEKLYGTVFVDAATGAVTQKQAEGSWIYNANNQRMNRTQLKKLCQQKVADGTYHTLRLSYGSPVHDYESDGSTESHWMVRDLEGKEAPLILEVFGNADTDFKLLQTISLPGLYTMAEFDGLKEDGTRWTEELRQNEFFMKRLNLLTADFNNDNVDDVVVGFCNYWTVFDGTDYTKVLAKRTFPTDCVRACVGDYDENGFADLGVIYQYNDQLHVHVLLDDIKKFDETENPSLSSSTDYYGTLPVEKAGISSFLDIKFDDITNTGNSVLCLAVANRHINKNPKSAFYVLQPDTRNNLYPILPKFEEEQKIELSNESSDRTSTNTNSTIAVVHTRGLGERPDVLLHNGLYRLNEGNEFEKVNMGGYKEDGTLIDAAILSDCVGVGRFTDDLPEGYEQLAYFGTRVVHFHSRKWSGSAGDIHVREIVGCAELLTPDTIHATMSRKELYGGSLGTHCSWSGDGDFHFGAVLPAFCATSYRDIDTRRYKFVSCQATMSEPRIKFALAAAPYWATVPDGYAHAGEDYDYGDNGPSTEWTTSTSTTEETENSNGTSASIIFGYEQENKVSVFGVEVGKYGFEFEANIGYEWEKSVSEATTYTFESGCSAGRDNKVGLTMTPVWLYTYECVESNDPDNIGTTLVCGAPSYPRDLELSETDYMLLRGDREDIPDISTVFSHTPGDPLTYPNNPDLIKSTGNILWSNNNKDQYSTTGSDGTKSFSIEVSRENSTTTSNTFSMDMSLVGFVGAFNHTIKAGFGVGYSHTWANTYTTGFGTTVTGTVPLPKSWGDVPMFDWNMCRYNVKVGGQEFPVVNYIVKNVRKAN